MLSELEYLIRTHSDHEVMSDQCSLRDVLIDLRRVADDLGLDFRLAIAGAKVENEQFPTQASFDPCI
jgi:hypothetical protein